MYVCRRNQLATLRVLNCSLLKNNTSCAISLASNCYSISQVFLLYSSTQHSTISHCLRYQPLVPETPEVRTATVEHLRAAQLARVAAALGVACELPGQVTDTPGVKEAKRQHFAAVRRAKEIERLIRGKEKAAGSVEEGKLIEI